MKRYKKIILSFVCILTVVMIIGTLIYSCLEKKEDLITAIEGKFIADELAKEWYNDALLVEVGQIGGGHDDNNGKDSRWYYKYVSHSTNITEKNIIKYERLYVYVMSNGTTTNETAFRIREDIGKPIERWIIDSDQAVKIAKENPKISEFLSKYKGAHVGLNLRMEDEYPNAIWSIGWSHQGFMDDPHNANIVIDATNGEILEVDTQMN